MVGFRAKRGRAWRLRHRGVIVLAAVALAATAGCASRHGIYHRVHPGDNLYRIGKAYGIPFRDLSRINNIPDPDCIRVGQKIFIPGAPRRLPVGIITPEQAQVGKPQPVEFTPGEYPFIWPVSGGSVTSGFGPRGDTFHDGIDIGAPHGTPVYAARAGEVLYSDNLRGYGNVIILRHEGGYATVYAHNEDHSVRVGARVRQGQVIAQVGESGQTSGSNLHFEVRKGNVARDPVYYLPPMEGLAGSGVEGSAGSTRLSQNAYP